LQLPDKLYWNTFLPILTAYFLFSFGYIVYMTFFVAWLVETGASPLLVSVVWVTLGLAVICAPFVWRRILSVTVGGRAFAACCVCMATGTLAPLLSANIAGILISPFAFGLGLFIAPTALTVFVRKNFPEYHWSRALALSTIVFGVGQAVGPMAVGLLTDLLGKIELGLLGAGLALLLGAGFALRQYGLKPLPMVDPG
jgi:predicted MFS family arabinose efflux permease